MLLKRLCFKYSSIIKKQFLDQIYIDWIQKVKIFNSAIYECLYFKTTNDLH